MNYLNLKKYPIGLLTKNAVPFKMQNAYKSKATAILQYYTANSIFLVSSIVKKISNALNGKKPKKLDFPKDTVIIYQFPRAFNTPSLSPFALKLETFCRAANINYQNRFGMKFSSKGLIPFIQLNNYVIDDSQKCIEYLTEIFEKDLNLNLTEEQKAISQAVLKMTEDSLFWCIAINRFWYNNKGRDDMKLPLLPYWLFSYKLYKRAWNSGYGRYSKEELFDIYCKNLTSLNVLIGKKKYLFSDTEPSVVDFAIFGVCSQIRFNDSSALNMFLNTKCNNVVRHIENIKDTYWSDWDDNIAKHKKVAVSSASNARISN